MEKVPATGQERRVVCGSALAGQPEGVRVRLVPDHHVPNLAVSEEDVADEAAVVLSARAITRCVGRAAVDPEHGPHAVSLRGDRPSERIVVGAGQVALARTPLERHAHASEPECPHRTENRFRSFRPLDAVVVHPDQEAGAGARRLRPEEQGQKQERECRSDSQDLICSHPRRRADIRNRPKGRSGTAEAVRFPRLAAMSALDKVWFDELSDLLRIQSVSADPAHADDLVRAAEWVADKIRRGGGEAELVPYGERPLVVGEIRASSGAESAPTILCYGHFDVQPPAPLDLWESDPFEATIRDEWLYARGVADDKGQLWMLLHAAGLLAAEGALPINIRIVSDGEEEVGGQSIVEFLQQDERGADACVIFDGGMESRDLPALSIATRGLAAFNLRVRTGERDLHSGMYGNAAMNAIHALMETLGGILPRDGRVPDALRIGIAPVTDEERDGLGAAAGRR